MQTLEATIDESGSARLLQKITMRQPARALVPILDGTQSAFETALLSEAALAKDWNRTEEDLAWQHLQTAH